MNAGSYLPPPHLSENSGLIVCATLCQVFRKTDSKCSMLHLIYMRALRVWEKNPPESKLSPLWHKKEKLARLVKVGRAALNLEEGKHSQILFRHTPGGQFTSILGLLCTTLSSQRSFKNNLAGHSRIPLWTQIIRGMPRLRWSQPTIMAPGAADRADFG